MFKQIFIFELKQWLKRPSIYIYFLVFFALAFLLGAAVSGMFSGVSTDTNSHVNSALAVASLLTSFNTDYLLGLITILICVALMAGCVQKDFQNNCFAFYFTKPISKFSYLIGRFSATFLLSLIVMFALILGLYLAFLLSPNDNGQIGTFKFVNFFKPFVVFLIPNTFLIGSVFFSLVTYTRNMTSGYVGSLVFIVVAGIARSITSDIDNKTISAILDPFGQQALGLVTEYWTPTEGNIRALPFTSYILYNRLFWIGLSLLLISITYFRFNFNQFLNPVSLFKRKPKQSTSQPSKIIQSIGHLPKVTQIFNYKLTWMQLVFLTKFEFFKITKSIFFYIIIGLSILLTVLVSQFSGLIYGTVTYPLTYMQIETSSGIFQFFLLILVVFYSGIVIWRERDCKVDELVGASPISNGILFISKFLSLVFLCLTVYFVCILTCIFIQSYLGYYKFEIGLYVTELIGLKIMPIIIQVALAVSIQVFFKNRYFGFFAMVLIVLGLPLIYRALNLTNSDMIAFNSSGDKMRYSDMNGYGHTLFSVFVYKLYWFGLMLVFGALAVMLYNRGKENSLKARFKQAKKQFKLPYKAVISSGMLLFFGCGSVLFYNTKILNSKKSEKELEKISADFEKTYKKYQNEFQPRIVESNVNVAIFPDELGCKIKGFYYLKNKHKQSLTKIFIGIPNEVSNYTFTLNDANKKFIDDKKNAFFGYELSKPLQPNDSIKLDFALDYFPKNFIIKASETQIVQNGTFFNSDLFPTIGYNPNVELSDNSTRKKYKLEPKPRMAKISDTMAYANTYISNDADWIRFECVVSTKEGQTAIAPGYLQKEWNEGERHFFHYKMNAPILNFYAFLSANYQVKKEKWVNPLTNSNVVNIEIYYQKGHTYNIDRMIKGIKKSLNYYTKNFSPYQHQQVRIIEFPRYSSFAQSFPNTIPFSESVGFVAKVNDADPNEVDYPFYITAHEVAHQWWAHQVIGANVQGCTLMSETMSQYSALMVMEKEFGQAAMSKFLKYEMNTYLKGRTQENKKEVPLLLCENQQYIHYNKGSVVMYALKDYLGEDTLNATLRRYVKQVAYQEAPYTNALEFYSYIKAVTPDSLKETVKDLFERIIVFDNSVKSWTSVKTNDGRYKITATLNCIKTKNDSLGKAIELMPNDWIDIGIFSKNEKNKNQLGATIYLKKIKLTNKNQKIELIIDREPFMFGIDPYYKLIDKDTGNNTKDINGKNIGGGTTESGTSVTVNGG